MAMKIRMARYGTNKKPFYRIVVADIQAPRDGKYIEALGTYDPKVQDSPIHLKMDRINTWIKRGAKPSESVKKLIVRIKEKPVT